MVDTPHTRMTAREFSQLPQSNQFIELIDGEIVVSPTPTDPDQDAVLATASYLKLTVSTGKVKVAPLDVYLDDINVVQPDVFWISGAESLAKLGDDGYWYGAPDLVIEVLSPSTAKRDKREKFQLYQQYGVREYGLIDPIAEYLKVHRLVNGAFEKQGIYGLGEHFVSQVLSGLNIPVDRLFI